MGPRVILGVGMPVHAVVHLGVSEAVVFDVAAPHEHISRVEADDRPPSRMSPCKAATKALYPGMTIPHRAKIRMIANG